jgi:hypothetical protein
MKVRLIGVPHFGREGELYNNVKGKVYFVLATHPGEWVTAVSLADATGLDLRSLFTLLRKWSGPTWHTLQRRKIKGFYHYQLSPKGQAYFARWYEAMPINRWKREITQAQQRKLKGEEAPDGTWYQDEGGHWRFKSDA